MQVGSPDASSGSGMSPSEAARDRKLRFLSNVDPVDAALALEGLDPETTLVVVVSKTFTTAETMLNARTVRHWLVSKLGEVSERGKRADIPLSLHDGRVAGAYVFS